MTQSNMADLIKETAADLGMDPLVLATIIGYETGGSYSPTQPGPTTQWGQHRGLIQFGEPQAKEYGVDWADPLNSQLGAGKAVSRYFKSNGWQPGMSELDAYSIVNAGGPGRYNASDANNGGAPGTARDKVEKQFGPHRDRATRMLGGEGFPGVPAMDPGVPTQKAGVLGFLGLPETDPASVPLNDGTEDETFFDKLSKLAMIEQFSGQQPQQQAPLQSPVRESGIKPVKSKYPDMMAALLGRI